MNKGRLLNIIMIIFCVICAFTFRNSVWIVCASMWLAIDNMENQYLKTIYKKNNLIKKLLYRRSVMYLNDIKIPEYFKKPNKRKLNNRIVYFRKTGELPTPIVVNVENVLVDGYTSYLIAKKFNLDTVDIETIF